MGEFSENLVRFRLRYATNLIAGYLSRNECKSICEIPINGFLAESVTYRFYTESEEHALYLTGVLNTNVVNDAIKPHQTEGLLGKRDIHRRPFEVCPIPYFNKNNKLHQKIISVAAAARDKLKPWINKMTGRSAQVRETSRRIIKDEIHQLDTLVCELLDGHVKDSIKSKKQSATGHLFDQHTKTIS